MSNNCIDKAPLLTTMSSVSYTHTQNPNKLTSTKISILVTICSDFLLLKIYPQFIT